MSGFGSTIPEDCPTAVHRNRVPLRDDQDNVFALGVGGRMELTQRMSINGNSFLTETQGDGFNGDIYFGFNITRTFTLGGKKS